MLVYMCTGFDTTFMSRDGHLTLCHCYQIDQHRLRIFLHVSCVHLVAKGPCYRELNWRLNKELIKKSVSAYKQKWSKKEGVDLRVLNEWECKVNECVDRRIHLLRAKHINRRKRHVLKSKRCLDYLHAFQHKFVLVPADKAANNVIVVCKKYYLEVVLSELNTTSTYEHDDRDYEHVVTEHLRYMTNNNISVEPMLRHLPSFYWLPKLHKQPYGTRFIAASNKCSTKPLSKLLTACLSKITCHFQEYCAGIYSRTGVNCFWIVSNSQQVLSSLNKVNYFSTAKHFDSFDFSTLYTSIPHASLKEALTSLINEAFRVRDNIFLLVGSKGQAYWSDIPSRASSQHSITEHKLIAFVEYLIDNIYVNVGDRVYRQCVGIPMGTDCAPLLANLFLFYYEYKYMKSLIKNNITLARKFNHAMRYIDDLLTLNNSAFEQKINDIYPSELQLKRTTECSDKLSYLDLLVTIDNGKYSTTVFDKRDSFKFDIVNFPHMNSNIPSKPAYGVYIS